MHLDFGLTVVAAIGIATLIFACRSEDPVWMLIYTVVCAVCLGTVVGMIFPVP